MEITKVSLVGICIGYRWDVWSSFQHTIFYFTFQHSTSRVLKELPSIFRLTHDSIHVMSCHNILERKPSLLYDVIDLTSVESWILPEFSGMSYFMHLM